MVEGINGAGKSTLIKSLKSANSAGNKKLLEFSSWHIHPVDLQRLARLDNNQYNFFIELVKNECHSLSGNWTETVNKIENCTFWFEGYRWVAYLSALSAKEYINSIAYAHIHEIYDGGTSFEDFRYLQLQRWRQFVQAASPESVSLLEANFFQYPLMEMMGFHLLNEQQILDYYSEFVKIVEPMNLHLFYLEVPNVARAIEKAALERVHERRNWIYRYASWFNRTAFATTNNLSGVDGIIQFCRERQRIEKLIIGHFKEIPCRILIRDDLI